MKKQHLHTYSFTNFDEESNNNGGSDLPQDAKKRRRISEVLSHLGRRACQRKNFTRKLPILSWLPEYNLEKLAADIIAGITLGLTTIPQVLGVANVAEIPPEFGLYSSFVGSFAYVLIGSTKYITIGPTSYTKGEPPEFSVLLCFITGIVTLLMSFFQLGFIVNLISKPVISGFTSAAAISITATQVKSILGLSFSANGFVEEVQGVFEHISESKWQDIVVGVVSLSSLYVLMKIELIVKKCGKFGPKFSKFLWYLATSRSVTVVVVSTALFTWIGQPSPVLIVGDVPSGFPSFKPPPFSFSEKQGNETVEFSLGSVLRDKPTALIVIPLIAFMEHFTITKAFAGPSKIDATQELLCLGVSNVVGSFFSSMPVTGAFGRTALNVNSGVQSPVGGVFTGIIIILALLVLTPQFYYIPKSTLSAVVIMAVIFMVDFQILGSIWRSKRLDLVPWIVTFLVSLLLGLEYGIMAGFLVSLIFLLYYASRPGIKVSRGMTTSSNAFIWLEIDRSMTFPSMEYVRYIVMKTASKWGHEGLPLVIDCQFVSFVDYTAAQGLSDIVHLFKERKQKIFFWNLKSSVREICETVILKNGMKAIFCANEDELDAHICNKL